MKPLLLLSLAALLSACSSTPSSSSFPLDSLLRFESPELLLQTLKDSATEVDAYGGILYKGTAQEVRLNWAWFASGPRAGQNMPVSHVDVTLEATRLPKSKRSGLPEFWKSRTGLYPGISLDTLQALNGKPFYLIRDGHEIKVASWDGGALGNANVNFRFEIDTADIERVMWSQYFVEKNIKVSTSRMSLFLEKIYEYAPELDGDFPQASVRPLTADDLSGHDAGELRFIRNEIFARHGYVFKSKDLQEAFRYQIWYKARFANVDDKLTDIERANILVIVAREEFLKKGGGKNGELRVLIKELPLLTLPFDYSNPSAAVTLSNNTNSPDDVDAPASDESDQGYDRFERKLYGLLPDTSKFYGVVWLQAGSMSVAGVLGTVSVTTLDKKFRKIRSAYIALHRHIDQFGSDCGVEEKTSAVINKDLSYSCAYHADISCPGDDDKTEESSYDEVVLGRINSDGTISEERKNK